MADAGEIGFPLEIVIEETPVSLAGDKARWQARVLAATRACVRAVDDLGFLDHRPVAVTILYFPAAAMQRDVDNIVKPILDGMKSAAYPDDKVVERVLVQKFEPGIDRKVTTTSEQLLNALLMEPPVVYIRIDDDLNWRVVS